MTADRQGSGAAEAAPLAALSDEAFVDALPKVELHLHLEGSITPETLLELRRRHGLDHLPGDLEALRAWYAYDDFAGFIAVFQQAVTALGDGEDFALLARSTGRDLAAQGVRYAELHVTPWLHASRGIPVEEVFAGIEQGRREAERDHGVVMRWITDSPGEAGVEAAEATLEAVLALDGAVAPGGSVVAFGLGGPEVPREPFAGVFTAAREAGLASIPHAGEASGPESVRAALDGLGATRIEHGITALGDEALVRRLRDEQIVLDVCPSSNIRTRVVADFASHPLPAMLEAGLAVTINSDDPPMFHTTLRQEYLVALRELGLSRAQLVACLRTAIDGSLLPPVGKAGLHAELDRALAAPA